VSPVELTDERGGGGGGGAKSYDGEKAWLSINHLCSRGIKPSKDPRKDENHDSFLKSAEDTPQSEI